MLITLLLQRAKPEEIETVKNVVIVIYPSKQD